MELTLSSDELEILSRVLTYDLSELRMEVSQTDRYEMRSRLKHDEEVLKALLARLDELKIASQKQDA